MEQTGLYPNGRERRDPLKRCLTPFDRASRPLREEANQAVATAVGEPEKSLAELQARLGETHF